MKSEYVMALVFWILGLLLGLQAMAFFPGMIWAASDPSTEGPAVWLRVMPQVLGLVLCLSVAYVLFCHGRGLAHRIVPEDERLDLTNLACSDGGRGGQG